MRSFADVGSRTAVAGLLAFSVWMAPRDARAVALPVEVDFAIRVTSGLYPGNEISTSGAGVAIVNGSGGGGHLTSLALPASLFTAAGLTTPVTDPISFPLLGLQLSVANGAGTFASGGGNLGGALPLAGSLRFCLFAPCGAAVANLSVPLTPIGVGGSAFVEDVVNVTVQGAPWTTGTAMLTYFGFSETLTGFAHGPASGTSSTAQVGGSLQLVTPIRVDTNIGADSLLFAFAILTVRFVPEPATALLVGGGIALLVGIRRGMWGRE